MAQMSYHSGIATLHSFNDFRNLKKRAIYCLQSSYNKRAVEHSGIRFIKYFVMFGLTNNKLDNF